MNKELSILKLINIKKDYLLKDANPVHALKGLNITFRKNEFVSILGPSGCGKTTLLNIIGGLDKYSDGDLIINNKSTKTFKDKDWDIYRNHRIGFIFQSYNLIPHQTILENVELALTIAGISKKERIKMAKEALDRVGLKDLYNKKSNQLSGGQCQRVAIARALVNKPDILLADEPTGALDTTTSTQIMDLIKEISQEKLVIMVTHNPDLALKYSTRIIKLLDGKIVDDSNPFNLDNNEVSVFKEVPEKAKMSFATAFKLSLRNLISKFKRTVLVCIAGSIGIVGVSTVLSVSSGIHNYIDSMQDDMLSGNPITISDVTIDLESLMDNTDYEVKKDAVVKNGYVNVNSIIEYLIKQQENVTSYMISNEINEDYLEFLSEMDSSTYASIIYDYGTDLSNNIYVDFKVDNNSSSKNMSITAIKQMYTAILKNTDFKSYVSYINQLDSCFYELPNNESYILNEYEFVAGNKLPTNENEIVLVIDKDYDISDIVLAMLGYFTEEELLNLVYESNGNENYQEELDKDYFSYEELMNKTFTYYPNDEIYSKNSGLNALTSPFTYQGVNSSLKNGIELKITGILKAKDDISYGCLSSGFYYTNDLAKIISKNGIESEIVKYYKEKDMDSITSGYITSNNIKIASGISFDFEYVYKNETYKEKGFLGTQSSLSSIISMFMGGSSEQSNYYQISIAELGGSEIPSLITIYPTSFNNKYLVTDYLDKWNDLDNDLTLSSKVIKAEDRSKITYNDNLELIIDLINKMINIVTYALIVFTALSLLVSTVMIGIITYVSVVERVKEIGVIRSLGGRKKDVSHLFNAESFIIGLTSGIFGILITIILSIIINIVVKHLTSISNIALVEFSDASIMIIISVLLTLISGLIPAKAAANKDPVVALRTE